MNDKHSSPRDRLTRLLQDVPEHWIADLLPVLLRVVALVRRFFESANDTPRRLPV